MKGRTSLVPGEVGLERSIRLLSILNACRSVGLSPLDGDSLHTLAYLCDALAPVWGLPLLDEQVLKQATRPFFPVLQGDLDRLVGLGVVEVTRLGYRRIPGSSGSTVDADYCLIEANSGPILRVVRRYESTARLDAFVSEVVYAASAFGDNVENVPVADATYSDPLVDVGGVIDMAGDPWSRNPTAVVANRFRALAPRGRQVGDGELVHLYVRHLYGRINVA